MMVKALRKQRKEVYPKHKLGDKTFQISAFFNHDSKV